MTWPKPVRGDRRFLKMAALSTAMFARLGNGCCLVLLMTSTIYAGAAPSDAFAQFTLAESTHPLQGGPLEEEGRNMHTISNLGDAASGYLAFIFDGDSVTSTGPGVELNAGGLKVHEGQGIEIAPPEIEVRVYGWADYYNGFDYLRTEEGLIYECTGDELDNCPVAWRWASRSCDRDVVEELTCPPEQTAYYIPLYLEVVATSGSEIQVSVYEATAAPPAPPTPQTTDGVIAIPAHGVLNTQFYECDVTISVQAGTGFRLESLDGADFDASLVEPEIYGPGTDEDDVWRHEAVGDEWGNVPGSAE